jgi:hypothetical protein
MYLPLIKVVLLEEINLSAHLLNLLAQALEKKIKASICQCYWSQISKEINQISFGISVT